MWYAAAMSYPALDQLPAPPAGRSGWPWTDGGSAGDGNGPASPTPSITVVIPSYQQGEFLEETLRSVILQAYPAIEILVMDGGSTDRSVEVLRRYEKWITAWVSEPDGGQTAAINKGWRRAEGEYLTWLNSDDVLSPGWAKAMAGALHADESVDLTYCDVQTIDSQSRPLWVYPGEVPTVEQIAVYWKTTFAQQGFLMRRRVLDACGYLDEQRHFAMDTEYWLRLLLAGRTFRHVPQILGSLRLHEATKTSTMHGVHVADLLEVSAQFCRTAPPEMQDLVRRARERVHWNEAHAKYDGRVHAEARRSALKYLRDGGPRVLPQVCAMVALSCLGEPGHQILGLFRRLRS